ncbi:glycosyltransferase [Miltoncostaea oceani]|jgi:hypothetical protein|uniref:glycosyltransferase n=1 Tax=Miltoncostaea oceani TaxID=2843216 RepID=UPI001C3DCC5F|nr:glycosyltransferase [Miltoncostaea oceani]
MTDAGRRAGGDSPAASFSVVVPTHGRSGPLRLCLQALGAQERPPDEVIVAHAGDEAARAVIEDEFPWVLQAVIKRPSYLDGLRAGASRATGDVICFTDDDAAPRPDWLARAAARLADPGIGAVGGRDVLRGVVPVPGIPVGVIGRWGRLSGNHHLGTGDARDVDVLKGVNIAVRRDALAFPLDLAGGSTHHHFEVALGLWVRRQGLRVVFDPLMLVEHDPAVRADGSIRFSDEATLAEASCFNLAYGILSLRPDLRVRRSAYGVLVGDRDVPGVGRAVAALVAGDRRVVRRLLPSLRGQGRAAWRVARRRPLRMIALDGRVRVP